MNAKTQPARAGFTLVELLVVIAIIGMLVALVTVATAVALGRADEVVVKIEVDNLAQSFQAYKTKYGSYPPNFSDRAALIRHLKRAFPRHQERPETIDALSPLGAPENALTPAEAVVFWLGGFSSNPEFPLTGPGGPLAAPTLTGTLSNIDDRTFAFEFDKTRLVATRPVLITNIAGDKRLVEVYSYHPAKLTEPYVYFDTSRGKFNNAVTGFTLDQEMTNWPIYRGTNGVARAFVKRVAPNNYEFINPKSFQVLAAGTDDEWSLQPSDPTWDTIWYTGSNYAKYGSPDIIGVPPSYPDGPYLGPLADNLVNFSTSNLEDSQP